MSTRGFEFAYMLDGSNATPLIRDFRLAASAAHKVGDLVVVASDGDVALVTTGVAEVTGIMQEAVGTADIDAGTTLAKVAIATRNQVWRCSLDATSTTAVVGVTKNLDTVDANTIDADNFDGSLCLVDSIAADDGTLVGYVTFVDTTFGNT